MFTGIIEEIGTIRHLPPGGQAGALTIQASKVLSGTRIGDSIAVNGICLTVTSMGSDGFTADVMPETIRRTALSGLRAGSPVNLERAMAADGRFGGHIVSGHIDGTGTIRQIKREANAVWVTIETDNDLLRYIVEKGSIAIDGISLTVANLVANGFQVSIIPHTKSETTLLTKQVGDLVNLETDIIGKYVQRMLTPYNPSSQETAPPSSGITEDFLKRYGF